MYLQYSIYNYVENKNSLVINFLQCVQWESFVLQEAQHMLSNTKNLKVFAWQRDTLIDIAQKTVEGSDIVFQKEQMRRVHHESLFPNQVFYYCERRNAD